MRATVRRQTTETGCGGEEGELSCTSQNYLTEINFRSTDFIENKIRSLSDYVNKVTPHPASHTDVEFA